MKKFLSLLFVGFLCLFLVGCGDKEQGNIIDNDSNDPETTEELKLYSDNTKMVFDFSGVYKIVYYYSGNKITGLEYYFNYSNRETAAYALAGIKASYDQEDNIASVKQKGSYIIVKFTEDEYKDTTVEEVKQAYSYLEQIYENN